MSLETVETWKKRLDLMDEDILTPGHLQRVAAQHLTQESEIVYCACGCGEFWLRPIDHEGRKQRFIRGHGPQRRTRAKVIISANRDKEIIQAIYNMLPYKSYNYAGTIADLVGISKENCIRYLEIIDLILNLQSEHWLEGMKVLGVKGVPMVYRRKPRREEKEDS
uniref:Uncharacterized protein n=1 Tax=viral metagenome TaxID=1070528 RepID=A0A6M3M9J4_9ZZZZ